jgi:endoglucanase
MRIKWILMLFLVWGCGNKKTDKIDEPDTSSTDDSDVSDTDTVGGTDTADTDSSSDTSTVDGPPYAEVTLTRTIRVNHFGWLPGDTKIAVLKDLANAEVELRRVDDDEAVSQFTSGELASCEDSGDDYSTVDFSSFEEEGLYYLFIPETNERSYDFLIVQNVYEIVGAVAMKSFYYQRCNHSSQLPYASDALLDFEGIGGQWEDDSCHLEDHLVPAGPDSVDHGPLDLHGGWHDAGDYQKTLWGRGVSEMLFAFELHQDKWEDGQLNIPESNNGIPDILDELKWELDFYLRLQRPEGHFITSVKGDGNTTTITSPPSLSDEARFYFDGTAPSGSGWSGGGVTTIRGTGMAVASLAHAAIAFEQAGQNEIADSYRQAALDGWSWLNEEVTEETVERRTKLKAAAAVYRMDSSNEAAKEFVEVFSWEDWDGLLPYSVTPAEGLISVAAWHCLSNEDLDPVLKSTIETAVGSAMVNRGFSQAGVYGGMFGDSSNGWDWGWGSNRNNSRYGANLFMAAHFGIAGDYTVDQVRQQAKKYFHYILGLNPLNMVYLTNMAAYGGEHSSFQIYHGWFSHQDGGKADGNALYNGKPENVNEPFYPYHPEDEQISTYGPAPGLMPGGPNFYYGGTYEMMNSNYPATTYRDWSIGCDWRDGICHSASWEVTEPMNEYQGVFVLLAAFMM